MAVRTEKGAFLRPEQVNSQTLALETLQALGSLSLVKVLFLNQVDGAMGSWSFLIQEDRS